MARVKKEVITGVTPEERDEALAEYAMAEAKLMKIEAEIDIEVNRIKDRYQSRRDALVADMDAKMEVVQAWAMEHKTMFDVRRSMETIHGEYGFRTGTPALKTLKGFTFAASCQLAKEFLPDYVRVTEELAKDKLIEDRDKAEVAALYPKIGVQVVQTEKFFIKTKNQVN
jgi:phage host-nuclease inhibitor protein Gam